MKKGEGKDSHGEGWNYIDYDDIKIGEIIGGGGIGVIYRGEYKRQEVAVKTFFDPRHVDESLRRDFLDELMVMSKVKHSNIVEFIGACTEPKLFFVMELCDASLFQILHVDKLCLPEKEIFQVCIDIACAIEYLHALTPSIIHRDVKSHNILKAFDGSYKLCDFGQVRVKSTMSGTPIYMAPELFLNKTFNKSVDVYSFGMLMWEIFFQEVPFYLVDVSDIRQRVISGDRPRLSSYSIPSSIAKLIKSCWSQASEDRPTFPDIVDELLDLNQQVTESKFVDGVRRGSTDAGDALDGLLLK